MVHQEPAEEQDTGVDGDVDEEVSGFLIVKPCGEVVDSFFNFFMLIEELGGEAFHDKRFKFLHKIMTCI